MPRFSRFLIGFGFAWMALWAIFGSLLGARINAAILAGEDAYVQSWARTLFRTAHAHMNSMAMAVVLIGLTFVPARRLASQRTLIRAAGASVVGMVVFGCGMTLEAFFPPARGAISWAAAMSAVGGIAYILAVGAWGALFLFGTRRA